MKTTITKTTIKKGLLAMLFTVVVGMPVVIKENPNYYSSSILKDAIDIRSPYSQKFMFEVFLTLLTISIITLIAIAIVAITFFLRKKRSGTEFLSLTWGLLLFFSLVSIHPFLLQFDIFMNLWLKVLSLIMMAMAIGIFTIIVTDNRTNNNTPNITI
jgi:hypothetical protein